MGGNEKFIVAGIGEILWDILPAGRQLGGAPANFAYFAKALGAEAYIVSRVGDDGPGRDLLVKLKELGCSRKYIAFDRAHATGAVEVRLDKDGKPAYDIKQNAAWDFFRFSPALRSLARKTNAVCFGSLAQRSDVSGRTIRRFIAAMPGSSLKVFDINLRQTFYTSEIIERLLRLANVFKLNDEELCVVADLFSIRGDEKKIAGRLLRDYRLRVVAVTKGPQGAVLYCPEGAYPYKGAKIKIVDTVGAGDAFTAGLTMGLLNGLKMEIIIELANRLAAYVCGRPGATPVLAPEMIKTMQAFARPFNKIGA